MCSFLVLVRICPYLNGVQFSEWPLLQVSWSLRCPYFNDALNLRAVLILSVLIEESSLHVCVKDVLKQGSHCMYRYVLIHVPIHVLYLLHV